VKETDCLAYELDLLEKLVAINTDSLKKKNYEKISRLLSKEAKNIGLKVKICRARASDHKSRPNLIVELDRGCKQTLLLATHFDTVSPSKETRRNMLKMHRKGKRLFGLGVCDDKGAIAVAYGVLKELAESGCSKNIKLVIACDEEVGGKYGLKYLSLKHAKDLSADGCIVLDSSFKHIGVGCSGVMGSIITFKSKEGHAGYPFMTQNIVHLIVPFLKDLVGYRKIMQKKVSVADAPSFAPFEKVIGRMSVTMLNAGHKTNAIPGSAKVGVDIRMIPEAKVQHEKKQFKDFVKKLLKKHSLKANVWALGSRGYYVSQDNKFVKEVTEVVTKLKKRKPELACELGGQDGRFIARLGIATVGYGPGGKDPHTFKESITISELEYTKKFIIALVKHEN